MFAIRARFDGKSIKLPGLLPSAQPGEVIVVFGGGNEEEDTRWLEAQQARFADVWDNDEDSIYDNL